MSDDALLPLRRAYGVEVPGSPAAGAASGRPGAPQRTEVALLAQTRAAVEAAVAAQDRHPSAAVLAAVLARAADASATALAPLAAVRALYGDPAGAPDPVEAAVLSQTRAAVELALSQRTVAPSSASLAAVLAYAADATRLSARPDDAVAISALVPLAVAYGLPLTSVAAPDAAETALLVQSRDLLDRRPVPAGPSDAVLAAVLACAASVGVPATETPAEDRPALAPAADRAPLRNARRVRRVTAWASAAAATLAVVVALMPRAGGAPEMPAATEAAFIGAARADSTPAASLAPADLAQVAEPDAPDALPAATAPAPAASTTSATPSARRSTAPQSGAATGPVYTSPPPAAPPRPAPPPPVPPRREAAPTTALAAADVTPASKDAWEAPSDVRVLSLRLQALGRTTADLGWDQPAEAFGAPSAAPSRGTPGLQSVRETVPAARARLLTVPPTGDR